MGEMSLSAPDGVEVVRVERPDQVAGLDDWVHDAYLEDAIQFSAESARAVIPFAQESCWGRLHASMRDPTLARETAFARHNHVPLTRCYLIVDHAASVEIDLDWGDPGLREADFSESTFSLRADSSPTAAVSVCVTDLNIRLLVSAQDAGTLYRKVLRALTIQSDRWLTRPS